MELTDQFEPTISLADQENFTGLADCRLILLTEAEELAEMPTRGSRPDASSHILSLEELMGWALA